MPALTQQLDFTANEKNESPAIKGHSAYKMETLATQSPFPYQSEDPAFCSTLPCFLPPRPSAPIY